MPGESQPNWDASEVAKISNDDISAELANQTVQEGVDRGRLTNDNLARTEADAENKARDEVQKQELNKVPADKLYRLSGEVRDTARVRRVREKISEIGAKAGSAAAETAGKEFAVNSIMQEKSAIHNVEAAHVGAEAWKTSKDLAANLRAMGSEELAQEHEAAADEHQKARTQAYSESIRRGTKGVDEVLRGESRHAVMRGKENLDAAGTVIGAFAGPNAEPVYETDSSRGKVHELYYSSSSNPNVMMVERRNGRTGEVISVHTLGTEKGAIVSKKGVELPSREIKAMMRGIRTMDMDKTSPDTRAAIKSKGPNMPYAGDAGEYAYLQRQKLDLNSQQAETELVNYRQRRKAQQKAVPFWARLFGG